MTRSAAWLRDSCVCSECRDAVSGQHLLDVSDLAGWEVLSDSPTEAVLSHVNGAEHICVLQAATDIGAAIEVAPDPRPHAIVHGSTDWRARTAQAVVSTGCALLVDVPTETDTVLSVAAELGFVRETNYGTSFDVVVKSDPNNLAYSARALPLHTDNPYRDPAPTVQLLHCLKPSPSGGETILADGFGASNKFRQIDPGAHHTLVTTPVRFRFSDATTDLSAVRSIIDLRADGTPRAVHVNHRSMLPPSPDVDAESFYAAYAAFVELCASPDFCASFTLDAGELLVFDNRRMLHARGEFPAGDGRFLQGCYIDIDALASIAATERQDSLSE